VQFVTSSLQSARIISMSRTLEIATENEAAEIAALRCAVSGGKIESTLNDVLRSMSRGKVAVMRHRKTVIATLYLTPRKPWAIDTAYFTPVQSPLYLLAMAVAVPFQRKGFGRACLLEAAKIARAWPAQAIRLDAYDCPTGAGGFYARCGYREVGRAVYRETPLIYYEQIISRSRAIRR
jgi:GNAT superfamily N-acetyltransferase